jgi:hypothetical protein
VAKPSISYAPRPDPTPESEISALVAVYRLCLSSHASKNAAGETSTNGGDAERNPSDSASSHSTTQT